MTEIIASAPVCVVIPNWNGAHLLPVCLDSLRRQTFRDFKTLVVDNGSSDSSYELLRAGYPEVAVLALPENLGFAAGTNAGIRASASDYVVLLNNDTEAADDWLERLVAAMRSCPPDFGFGASKLIDFTKRDIIDRIGDSFAPFGLPLRIGSAAVDDGRFEQPFETFGACAAASIYRRVMLDEIGLLAEDYFAYVEDVDLSIRAQLAGYRCQAVTDARVFHMGSASSGGDASAFSIRLTVRNIWCTIVRCIPMPLLISTIFGALILQCGLVLAALLFDRGPIPRRHVPAFFKGWSAAWSALPDALRQRRAIPRQVSVVAFRQQIRLGYRQWRQFRPSRSVPLSQDAVKATNKACQSTSNLTRIRLNSRRSEQIGSVSARRPPSSGRLPFHKVEKMARNLKSVFRKLRERRLEVNIAAWRMRRFIHRRLPSPCSVVVGRTKLSIHHRKTLFDNFAIYQCFHEEQYQVPASPVGESTHRTLIKEFYRQVVREGETPLIVDCGAHIGAATVWLNATYPGSHCIAVEPSAHNVAVLERNVAGLTARVIHAGIGVADGEARLYSGLGSMDFSIEQEGADGRTVGPNVAVRSLRSLLDEPASAQLVPFILKVDIEGGEKALFREVDWDVFDRFPVIIVEGHDFATPGRATTSSFFRFHGGRERDFLFGAENIFSIDVAKLRGSVADA